MILVERNREIAYYRSPDLSKCNACSDSHAAQASAGRDDETVLRAHRLAEFSFNQAEGLSIMLESIRYSSG